MIRILHVLPRLARGGSQTMVMNLYRAIDRSIIQFDFVVFMDSDNSFYDEIISLGGKVYKLNKLTFINFFKFLKEWISFFKHHSEYRIIHSHVRSCAVIYLLIAKMYGLKTIIHSHNISNGSGILSIIKHLLQFPLRYVSDYYFACSEEAGKWLFGNSIVYKSNYKVIPNAIDVEKFKFNYLIRKEYREKISVLDNTKVFMHVGRFHEQKNHKFLIELFASIHEQDPNSILVLLGDGELRSQIEKQIKELDLRNSVKLLGIQSNVNCWLQAADCFLFPSLYEGLGIVAIEAQAAGIPCICSEFVPKMASVSKSCKFLPLQKEIWLKEILDTDYTRINNIELIKKAGFDIKTSSVFISNFYKELK